jgi:SAM-dependent methyltransferase
MRAGTAVRMLRSGELALGFRLFRAMAPFYRLCFLAAAIEEGILDALAAGPRSSRDLAARLGPACDRAGLESWLELGVKLGELGREGEHYTLAGRLSRSLAREPHDPYRALVMEIAGMHHDLITGLPRRLRAGRKVDLDPAYGELVARSSRVSEPLIRDVLSARVPATGAIRLLEVGCGSAAHIRFACERNPDLEAVGLELQPEVADFARENIADWGLSARVVIRSGDVRSFAPESPFDVVTLHQNIYYFPVEERVALARKLRELLAPGGTLLLTSACQGGSVGLEVLNLWAVTTEGCGALPEPDRLCAQLREAGFEAVRAQRLVPFESFFAFTARRPAGGRAAARGSRRV